VAILNYVIIHIWHYHGLQNEEACMHIKFGKSILYGGEIIDGQRDGRGTTLNAVP